MRHLQITAFIIRLIGLALVIHVLWYNFDVGVYGDAPTSVSSEPSFRLVGIYLLPATRAFWITAFILKLVGSLQLAARPQLFARLLWSGIALTKPSE